MTGFCIQFFSRKHQTSFGVLLAVFLFASSLFAPFSYGQTGDQKANIQVMMLAMPMGNAPKQLRQNFRGYRVIISNMGDRDISIEKAVIENGYDGKTIYNDTRGKVFKWSSLKSLGISSAKQANRNRKARRETKQHPNIIKLGALHTGDFKDAITFVPAGQQPRISILYRDSRTGNLHEFKKK